MSSHSPLPWRVEVDSCAACRDYGRDGEYQIVGPDGGPPAGYHAHFANRADAEFIVTACNSHHDLLAALKLALDQAEGRFNCLPYEEDGTCARRCIRELPAKLRAAIAKAETR